MYLLRITNPPLSGINAVMSLKESFYPWRLYEATLSWGRGPSLLDAVGMERVMFSQLVCINEKQPSSSSHVRNCWC